MYFATKFLLVWTSRTGALILEVNIFRALKSLFSQMTGFTVVG